MVMTPIGSTVRAFVQTLKPFVSAWHTIMYPHSVNMTFINVIHLTSTSLPFIYIGELVITLGQLLVLNRYHWHDHETLSTTSEYEHILTWETERVRRFIKLAGS